MGSRYYKRVRDAGPTRFAVRAVTLAVAIVSGFTPSEQAAPAPPAPGLEVLWQTPVSVPGVPHMVAGDALIFLVSSEAPLSARAPVDGRSLWSSTLPSTLRPGIAGAHIGVVSNEMLHVLHQETGAVAWTIAVAATASAVFSFGKQFGVIDGAEMRAFTAAGTPGWRTALPGAPTTRVISRDGTLFVGVMELPATPWLVALDESTGALRWRIPLAARAESLSATDDRLYLSGADASLYAYRTTGQSGHAWRRALVGAIGDALADDRQVYFALLDNSVRGFERTGGAQRWDTPQAARPITGPLRVGSNLAIALTTGAVVELNPRDGRIVSPKAPLTVPAVRLQRAVTSADGTRVFALTIASNQSQTLTAWGHPPPAKR